MRRLIPLVLGLALLWAPTHSEAVTMQTTRFVAGFEGFVSCPYADPAGHATIGYGHLLHYGPPTRADRKKWGCLTKAEALKLLKKDLRQTEKEVFDRIRGAKANAPMITALTSFAFNLGAGYLDFVPRRGKRPATNIGRAMRVGKYWRAAKQMLYFDGVIVGGKRYELAGLRIRRRKEYRLISRGIRQLKACDGVCKDDSGGGIGVK
ncbi:MAG: lysozyme [Solirubrobacterales bacterium]|nr:lysozyme [Solirubrobacterales bacterium]MCB0859570.1 lysozyme [Solirubrobacterales bacterium]HRV59497.1 lysozyme [Solirubrobacterales bacterium]